MLRKSITFHLTLLFAATSTAVLVALGMLVGASVEAHFEDQDSVEINGKLELVGHALFMTRLPSDFDALPQHLSNALVGSQGLSLSIVAPDGHFVFATSDANFPEHLMAARLPGSRAERSKLVGWESAGHAFRGIAVTMISGVVDAGPFTVAIALDISHHREFMTAFRKTLWISVAFGILLAGLLGWLAARRGLAPVRVVAQVAKGISASRLADRLPHESVPAELTDLATSFNDMLDRLQDSFRRLSNFSSELAHELRTPVSNLMTQTQVALSQSRSADEYREILHSSLEEYDRLARMIADMLFLAKADNGLIVPHREGVDLATEVDALLEFYDALAEEQGVHLSRSGVGRIAGDKLMIRRAISNLLSNAIRHTPRGGSIKVEIRDLGKDGARIAVENPGEGIPAEKIPRLFDRFYRVDSSRQRSGEGAGLGLAITKSIVEAHGGTISVSAQNGIVRFEISMGTAA